MRVKIVGDHSALHSGCRAVIKTIKDSYPWATFVDGEEYDALIVNGEGSMHHSSGGWHKKMIQVAKGISYGVPVYLVNSVWQENDNTYDKWLNKISGVWFREYFSLDEFIFKHFEDPPKKRPEVAPDLSLWCDLKHDPKDVTAYHGIVCTEDYWHKDQKSWSPMPCEYERIDMQKDWGALIESLKTADCLISGRHHAIYAAILAGIPFVPIEGNTWKNAGICYYTYTQNIEYYQDALDLPKRASAAMAQSEAFDEITHLFSEYKRGPVPLPDLLSLKTGI